MDKVFNWFSIVFGVVGGFFAAVLGGWDKWLIALVAFVCIDYVTGVVSAIYTKTLSSEIGFRGLMKKILIFVVVAVAVILQGLLENAIPLRDIAVCFYLANEGISLLENVAMFLPIPKKIRTVLLQIREKGDGADDNHTEIADGQ